MKSLNVKKLAAVGAGLALVAASVSAAVSWNDIADDNAKKLNVSGIVVGSDAKDSDSVAAQKLAATIAEAASYTEKESKTETVCEVKKVPVPGTGYYEFDPNKAKRLKYQNNGWASTVNRDLSYTNVEGLIFESSKNYTLNNSKYNTDMREKVHLGGSIYFNDKKEVKDLVYEGNGSDLKYTISFDNNIDFRNAKDYNKNSTWYANLFGHKDWIEVPFLGEHYLIYNVTNNGHKIIELQLFKSKDLHIYRIGDTIDVKGKDGKLYTVKVLDVYTDGDNFKGVKLGLYDAEGKEVPDYTLSVGLHSRYAEDMLDTYVEVVDYGQGTSGSWDVYMVVGDVLTLKDGEGFPYDSAKPDLEDYNWKVSINSDLNQLKSIELEGTFNKDFVKEDAIRAKDSIHFYNDFMMVQFAGLELPEFGFNNTEVNTIEVGKDVSYGVGSAPGLKFLDTDDVEHEIPFYMKLRMNETDNSNYDYYKEFEFDGKKWTLYINKADAKAAVEAGSKQDSIIPGTEINKFADSDNADWSDINVSKTVAIKDSEEHNINYTVVFDSDDGDRTAWLLLHSLPTNYVKYGSFTIDASYKDVSDDYNSATDVKLAGVYVPDEDDFADVLTGANYDSEDTPTLVKMTFNDEFNDIVMFFNSNTEEFLQYDDDGDGFIGSANFDGLGAKGQAYVYNIPTSTTNDNNIWINKGTTGTEYTSLYNKKGTKVVLNDDYTLTITVPEEQVSSVLWAYTKAGAGELKGVEYQDKNVCEEKTTENDVQKYYEGIVNGSVPVMFDTDEAVNAAENSYIVIGGYYVNDLYPDSLHDKLQKAGDKVSEKVGNLIVLAGYTAEDTTEVVDELINAIKKTE